MDKQNTSHKPTFLIMAGGSGGHIFPGLAVAHQLQKRNFSIHWLGTQKGLESTLIPKQSIPIHFIQIKGLRGKSIKEWLVAPFKILHAIRQAYCIMKQIKPVGVLGFGGFVSGPGCIAAWLLNIPLFIHEQNAVAGFTNKISAYFATKIFTSFPNTFNSSSKTILTGNPVRQDIQYKVSTHPPSQPIRLLVLGGSLGALMINETLPQTISKLNFPVEIWHQTGKNHQKATQKQYDDYHITVRLDEFIDTIADAYHWADLVICRSGAMTVAELCVTGKPAILIPYPAHKDQQQVHNALYLVNQQAAKMIEQHQLTATYLAQLISELNQNQDTLKTMGERAHACANTEAVFKISDICEHYGNA